MNDALGRPLVEGCDVIYILSGYLAKGTIVSIDPDRMHSIHIEYKRGGPDRSWQRTKTGHVSRVKYGESVVRV